MDKNTVEDALYRTETKTSLIALADKLGIPIKKDKGKIVIASQLAVALTKPSTDIEKAKVSEKLDKLKKEYPSSFSPPLPAYSYSSHVKDEIYLLGKGLFSEANSLLVSGSVNTMIWGGGVLQYKAAGTRPSRNYYRGHPKRGSEDGP